MKLIGKLRSDDRVRSGTASGASLSGNLLDITTFEVMGSDSVLGLESRDELWSGTTIHY